MQYTLHLIDGFVLEIDRAQAELLVASTSDDYKMDSNGNVIQRARQVNPFQSLPDVLDDPNEFIEWWIEPALRAR